MSDFERNKFYNKKKYSNQRADSSFNSRFFNNKGNYNKDDSHKDDKDDKNKNIKRPTILLKNRDRNEDRSVSPRRTNNEKEPVIQIVQAPQSEASHTVVKQMTKSIKLIEDGMLYSERIQDYLQESNDFIVVGIVGAQGVGKSTILNLLSQTSVSEKLKRELFSHKEMQNDDNNVESNIKILVDGMNDASINENNVTFKINDTGSLEANTNVTHGVDIYVTKDRLLLLDSQPIMSMAVLDDLMRSENKRMNVISEFLPIENCGEIQGLQLTAFLMSVCHVIIFVQDWFFDSNVIRFLQTAEMLRPTTTNLEEEVADHYPHLIILQNKAQMDDFTPSKFGLMQQFYRKVFDKTKMRLASRAGLGTGLIIPSLSPENCGSPINLYLLPEYELKSNPIFNGHPPLEELVKILRSMIVGITKYSLSHVQLSEKNWIMYCVKVWEHVRKSPFFVEYTKQMP